MRGRAAVLLVAHGTVDSLDELPEFLTKIRRGHAPPPALLAEVRRRYEAIGGRSPLNDVTREVARRLEARLGVPVRVAMRLSRPEPRDALAALAAEGVERVAVVPLAQHSAHVYGAAVEQAARALEAEGGPAVAVTAAPNWGRAPELIDAFASEAVEALRDVPEAERARAALLMTAHSLPMSVIEAGDPYEREVRASAEEVAATVRARAPWWTGEPFVAFQSQGMGGAGAWLGPDLVTIFGALAAGGAKQVVVAPIGFLADHIEILYDLDIEARAWASEAGLMIHRARSLNASDGLVGALASVASSTLARLETHGGG